MTTTISQQELSTFMEWHTLPIEDGMEPNYGKAVEAKTDFGILRIRTPKMPLCKTPLAILLNLDNSCSMSDNIYNVKHTLKNMLNVCMNKIKEYPDLIIYVCIDLFSHEVVNLFHRRNLTPMDVSGHAGDIITIGDFVLLNAASMELFITQINRISPWGCTNIEKSLRSSKQKLADLHEQRPEIRLAHIQLTDGEATAGEKTVDGLCQHIDESYRNVFVGYGEHHDGVLLSSLAEKDPKFDYRFVDNLDHCGMIYGELLYHILYPYDDRPLEITASDGLKIYDWKTNTWVSRLTIPPLCGDTEKVYHVCVDANLDKSRVYVSASFDIESPIDVAYSLPRLCRQPSQGYDSDAGGDDDMLPIDLTQYLLRQRVQECLAFVRDYEICRAHDRDIIARWEESELSQNDVLDSLMYVLSTTIELLKDNMKENVDPAFIQTLLEDLESAKAKVGTPKGFMYTTARMSSQGNQNSYTPSSLVLGGHETSTYTNDDMMNMMTQVYAGADGDADDDEETWRENIVRTVPYDESARDRCDSMCKRMGDFETT
jgi:hypothetical protein